MLYGVSQLLPFLVDAVSYLVSFVALLFVRPQLQGRRVAPRRHLLAEVGEGIAWLWRQRLLRALVALIGVTNFVFNAMSLVLIVRAQQLGATPGQIGLMFGAMGVGAIIGAVAAPSMQRRLPAPVVMIGALWLWAVMVLVLPAATTVAQISVVIGLGSLAGPPFNVVIAAYRYALVPDRLQARVLSASRLVAWGTIPVATLTAGLVLEVTDPPAVLLALAGLMTLVAIAAVANRRIRHAPAVATMAA